MKIVDDDGQMIAEGQVLTLESCDVVVFTASRSLRNDEREAIVEQLRLTFPDNKVSLIMGGDELSILRHADLGEPAAGGDVVGPEVRRAVLDDARRAGLLA